MHDGLLPNLVACNCSRVWLGSLLPADAAGLWPPAPTGRRPLPRTSHQAVIHKGYMYVFGGEFTSLNQASITAPKGSQSWLELSEPALHLLVCCKCAVPLTSVLPCLLCEQEKFRHYNDLWRLSLVDWRWEQLPGKGGPSPRSGHRMALYKTSILLFGGFFDNGKETK